LVAVSDAAVISGFSWSRYVTPRFGTVFGDHCGKDRGYQRFYDDIAVYLIKTALKFKYRGIRWFDANFFSVGSLHFCLWDFI